MTRGYGNARVIVVTGGSRNIGRAICERFARDGARVVINGVVPGEAARVVDELVDAGLDAVGWDADISDPAQVEAMFAGVQERFGRLDVLVNNAAVTMQGRVPFARLTLADWDRIFAVNARGTFLCSAAAAPLALVRRDGHRRARDRDLPAWSARSQSSAHRREPAGRVSQSSSRPSVLAAASQINALPRWRVMARSGGFGPSPYGLPDH